MAGYGPAPKDPTKRIGRGVPLRGEWQDLPPLTKTVLPPLPRDGDWSDRAKKLWAAWRKDPVTQTYGESEIAMALETIRIFEIAKISRGMAGWAELRQWMDRLALTPKGKRDLRYRIIDSPVVEAAKTKDKPEGLRLAK